MFLSHLEKQLIACRWLILSKTDSVRGILSYTLPVSTKDILPHVSRHIQFKTEMQAFVFFSLSFLPPLWKMEFLDNTCSDILAIHMR